jgi:SAM-dependent methyltransferase
MSLLNGWRSRLGRSYWAWRFYHSLIADAVAIQKPTKHKIVYDFLGRDLGTVADLGCGPGVFTRYLCAHAKQVWAADIDTASLARVKGRHRYEENLAFVVMDAERLPFPDGRLNTVLFLEVLEHVQDDAAALCEVRRVLAPGGRLVLSVPVPPGEVDEEEPWGHKREGYQLKEIESLLRGTGFEVKDHRFAQFRFSRLSDNLVRYWRRWLHLPAPIFLAWVGYLDHLLGAKKRENGDCLPATVIVLAAKEK